jgi:hypothetical protein
MPAIHIPTRCHPALHGHRVPHRPKPRRVRRRRAGRPHLALGPAWRRARADQPHGLVAVRRRRAATLAAECTTDESRSSTRLPDGLSTTRPGSSAGYAPSSPRTKCRCGSSPATPDSNLLSPGTDRSPSPCARSTPADQQEPLRKERLSQAHTGAPDSG